MNKHKGMIVALALAVIAVGLVGGLAINNYVKSDTYIEVDMKDTIQQVKAVNESATASPVTQGFVSVTSSTELFNAVKNSSVGGIKLDGDVTVESPLTINRTVTLDLSGNILNYGGEDSSSVIVVLSGGNLTIKDSNIDITHYYKYGPNNIFAFGVEESAAVGYVRGGVICGGSGTVMGTAAAKYGGGILIDGGSCEIMSGTIAGNSTTYGGGVYAKGGSFTISGGTIAGNFAVSGGGIGAAGAGQVNISNKNTALLISNNKALINGGGVYLSDTTQSLSFSGGSISNNSALAGGGIYANCPFKMTGGDVLDNSSQNDGAGLLVNYGGFTMTSGTVSGNNSTSGVAGVYVSTNATITLSGSPVIHGNIRGGIRYDDGIKGGSANNLYVAGDKSIIINGTLTDGAKIHVSGNPSQTITSGYTEHNGNASPANYFEYDSESYSLTLEDGEIVIMP